MPVLTFSLMILSFSLKGDSYSSVKEILEFICIEPKKFLKERKNNQSKVK